MDKGGTQCGGDEDKHGREGSDAGGWDGDTKWGYGGDGVTEGMRYRARNRDAGTQQDRT